MTMGQIVLMIYVVGFPFAWFLIAGMEYADRRGNYPTSHWRDQLGWAIGWGWFAAIIWPFMVPLEWCLTGFARHGIWRVRK